MKDNFENFSDSDLLELRGVFYSHAYEIMEDLQDLVLEIETGLLGEDALKTMKRYVHTLKGDSRSMGLIYVGNICHRMEDIFSLIESVSGRASHEAADLLIGSVDAIHKLLRECESGLEELEPKEMLQRIDSFLEQNTRQKEMTAHPAPDEYQELEMQYALKNGLHIYEIDALCHPQCKENGVAAYMITQRLKDLGHIINSAPGLEETAIERAGKITVLLSTKLSPEEIVQFAFIAGITGEITVKNYKYEKNRADLFRDVKSVPGGAEHKNEILRIEVSKVDRVMNLVGELIIGRSMIDQVTKELRNNECIR